MDILEKVCQLITHSYPAVPPENGGILGIRDGVVCEYLHDRSSQLTDKAVYIPDVQWINCCIEEWNRKGISFGGIIHSHLSGQMYLSDTDKEYIHLIMNAMPGSVNKLYFPIIIPGEKIICFSAWKTERDVVIREEAVHIIHQ